MELKLAGCVKTFISLLQAQKIGETPMFRTFFGNSPIFHETFRLRTVTYDVIISKLTKLVTYDMEIIIFSLWRHSYL